ncbi:MAG TPA: ferrochelatase [Burkholderiales bacterium]|nr:ferrochelatase [Burkholderiales bacterium]
MKNRIAVVLFNLGGPDSLDAVQPFLYNLFSDPDLFRLRLPWLTQKPFAALVSRRRTKEASMGYAAIGGASPLLANTRRQADALVQALADDGEFDVHICMRYWHPRAAQVVAELKERGYSHVVLLPLYPQYSRTTTGSSYNEFQRECARMRYQPTVSFVREWHNQPDYIDAIAQRLRNEAARFPNPNPAEIALLFSAHGLPRKIVDDGDPYEQQVRATFEAVRSRLAWPHATLCYQSRVGPLEWLRPYTDDVIRDKARAGVKQLLVYPIAFVSDHVETLFELGQTYAELARSLGIGHYRVAPALNDDPGLIRALSKLVKDAVNSQ